MGQWTEDMNKAGAGTSLPFPKMLTMDDVQQILNLGKPMVYALLRSGEIKAAQFGLTMSTFFGPSMTVIPGPTQEASGDG